MKGRMSLDLRNLPDAFYDDPYPTYRALLAGPPVHRLPDGSLLISRHRDLEAVYRDVTTFTSDKKAEFGPKFGASPLYEHHTTSLVFNDPPLHTRVRRIIAGALTPRAIADREAGLVQLVDRLLDSLAAKPQPDLIEDFAAAIPVEVIGDLLAVPRADRGPLRAWSLAILGALEPAISDTQFEAGNAAVRDFTAYLAGLVAERRARPGDPERDVLTRLIQGGDLSEAELLQNCIFILNAGHETTTNLIGSGLWLLTQWPEERARLLADPDPDLVGTAVEEFLRFESSNQLGNRMAAVDTHIGGVPVAAGSRITLCIGAANRDPDAFPDPDRLDIGRRPNRHLAFASGPHQCVGMSLARLEGRIAIGRLLARFPRFEITDAVRGRRARFRGFTRLQASLDRHESKT
jgi:cytochrome P450